MPRRPGVTGNDLDDSRRAPEKQLDPIKPLTPAKVPSTNFQFWVHCKFELS